MAKAVHPCVFALVEAVLQIPRSQSLTSQQLLSKISIEAYGVSFYQESDTA